MDRMIPVYYVIQPKSILKTKLSDTLDSWIYFLEPYVWVSDEYYDGVESETEIEQAINTMKIAFMLRLMKFQGTLEDTTIQILGDPPLFSIQMFDKWWTIDRYYSFGDIQTIIERASAEEIQRLQKTNISKIDQWLEQLIQIKLTGEHHD